MTHKAIIINILILITFSGYPQSESKNDLVQPLSPPYSFSGGFGELRTNHFHTGIDFRTGGSVGLPVKAINNGWVSRIVVSPTGYGLALYVDHPDGRRSVYGHLLKFNPLIESFVRKHQYEKETYEVDLTIDPDELPVRKGTVIAYSGNSGSSGGPHLHFEIRDSETERALNPMKILPGLTDRSKPRIAAFYAYPLTTESTINGKNQKILLEVVPQSGGYKLKSTSPILLKGRIGFGFKADDDYNGTGMKLGICEAQLKIDNEPAFGFTVDQLSFSNGRYVNAHIDYDTFFRQKSRIQRLYRLPGNMNSIYNPSGDGEIVFTDGKLHTIDFLVVDQFGNRSVLSFKVQSGKSESSFENVRVKNENRLLFDEENRIRKESFQLILPKGVLYEDMDIRYKESPRSSGFYSSIHQIQTPSVPMHSYSTLSVRCESLPKNLSDKALLVAIDEKNKTTGVGGVFDDGWVKAQIRSFGTYAVKVDTTPPSIQTQSFDKGNRLTTTTISFKSTDNLSGIKSYRGEIDGKWVLFEYDAKSASFSYKIDRQLYPKNIGHKLSFTVTDNKLNSSTYAKTFHY